MLLPFSCSEVAERTISRKKNLLRIIQSLPIDQVRFTRAPLKCGSAQCGLTFMQSSFAIGKAWVKCQVVPCAAHLKGEFIP